MIDVIIAGAGPNGLMLACELALSGVHPVVLERHPEPTGEPRANGLVGQVVRLLDRRGLHERLTGDSTPPAPQPAFTFGAFPLDLTMLADNPHYVLGVPQAELEAVLAARATELGVDIRRGHEIVGLRQQPAAVEVTLGGGATLTARFLVGADGGHSTVRRLAGIAFPGVTTDRSVSRTATVSVPPSAIDPATSGLIVPGYGVVPPFQHTRTPDGLIAWAPFPGRPALLTTTEWPATPPATLTATPPATLTATPPATLTATPPATLTATPPATLTATPPGIAEPAADVPMSLAEMRASAARVLGTAAAAIPVAAPDTPGLLRRLTSGNTRIAERYRSGRVLLVGDAAHVHPAMGGPGLNLGLQDAANLGWKLAATVRGWAPPTLLDTYESERRPVAERVVMSTRAQQALIAPGDDVTGLRALFAELLRLPAVTGHIAALMSAADVHYTGTEDHPETPLAGRTAPDVTVNGIRLAALTRTARPLLLDGTGTTAFAETAAPWKDRVDVVTGRLSGTTATALLVRPDCFVAWSAPGGGVTGLRRALTCWFGRPA